MKLSFQDFVRDFEIDVRCMSQFLLWGTIALGVLAMTAIAVSGIVIVAIFILNHIF